MTGRQPQTAGDTENEEAEPASLEVWKPQPLALGTVGVELSLGLCGSIAESGYLPVRGGEIPDTLQVLLEPPSSKGQMQGLGERTEGQGCASGPEFAP